MPERTYSAGRRARSGCSCSRPRTRAACGWRSSCRRGRASRSRGRVQSAGAPLGDVFRFASGLYFRGKLAYARGLRAAAAGRAGRPRHRAGRGARAGGRDGAGRTTCAPSRPCRWTRATPRFRAPLERDALALAGPARAARRGGAPRLDRLGQVRRAAPGRPRGAPPLPDRLRRARRHEPRRAHAAGGARRGGAALRAGAGGGAARERGRRGCRASSGARGRSDDPDPRP